MLIASLARKSLGSLSLQMTDLDTEMITLSDRVAVEASFTSSQRREAVIRVFFPKLHFYG